MVRERERPGLGTEIFDAFEAALDLLEEDMFPLSPLLGKSGANGAKRLILKRCPYDIVVIVRSGEVSVVAISHPYLQENLATGANESVPHEKDKSWGTSLTRLVLSVRHDYLRYYVCNYEWFAMRLSQGSVSTVN